MTTVGRKNVRRMTTTTVTTKIECENETQSKITVVTTTTRISWYAVPDAVNVRNSLLNNSSIFGDTIEPDFPIE